MGLDASKPVFVGFAKNKGADHMRRLISAFVIHFSENIVSKLATGAGNFSQGFFYA